MNILFIYNEIVVEKCNGEFYHNFLGDIIDRYSLFGNLTVCVAKQEVETPVSKKIDKNKQVKFEFIDKENTIEKSLCRKNNINILKNLIKAADFVIIHVPCSVQDLVAKWCEKFGKPYMGVVVGCPWDSLTNHSFKGKLLAPLSYLSLRKFMKKVPYAIYVTDSFLQKRYPTEGRYIGCSDVAIPSFKPENIITDRISLIKKENDTINLVSVGAVGNPVKGHEDIIKALKYLNSSNENYKYHLIGGGDAHRLKVLAQELGVEEDVIFHGQKSHEDIFSLLKGMHIYLQPSRTEGLSRAIIEALSVGCPVIATEVGGNVELIRPEYLYKPGAISELVRLIIRLSNKNEQISYAKLAIDKAQQYSREKLDVKRMAFLNEVIEKI